MANYMNAALGVCKVHLEKLPFVFFTSTHLHVSSNFLSVPHYRVHTYTCLAGHLTLCLLWWSEINTFLVCWLNP